MVENVEWSIRVDFNMVWIFLSVVNTAAFMKSGHSIFSGNQSRVSGQNVSFHPVFEEGQRSGCSYLIWTTTSTTPLMWHPQETGPGPIQWMSYRLMQDSGWPPFCYCFPVFPKGLTWIPWPPWTPSSSCWRAKAGQICIFSKGLIQNVTPPEIKKK